MNGNTAKNQEVLYNELRDIRSKLEEFNNQNTKEHAEIIDKIWQERMKTQNNAIYLSVAIAVAVFIIASFVVPYVNKIL